MEKRDVRPAHRLALALGGLSALAAAAFAAGLFWAALGPAAHAADGDRKTRVVYPKKTNLDFEGIHIEGDVNNPGEFYFQHRPDEKFDSLVKRRKNFHREMLRDVMMSR